MAALIPLLWLAAGCHRGPAHCAPGTRSTLEVRDGTGALTLALKGHELCNSQLKPVATLEPKKDGVILRDPAGNLRLELTRESQAAAAGRDREGPHLRLYRDTRELRVLRGDGVPLGSIAPQGNAATIFNPASQPLGKVAMRDADAVVTDLVGTALTYVVPARDPAAAGVFGVPGLDPADQVAIYIFWSR